MLVALAINISGCASTPSIQYPQNLESRSAQFAEGKAAYSEVIGEFGKPGWEGTLPNGKKAIAYVDGNKRGVTITRLELHFDDKDVLESKTIMKLNFK